MEPNEILIIKYIAVAILLLYIAYLAYVASKPQEKEIIGIVVTDEERAMVLSSLKRIISIKAMDPAIYAYYAHCCSVPSIILRMSNPETAIDYYAPKSLKKKHRKWAKEMRGGILLRDAYNGRYALVVLDVVNSMRIELMCHKQETQLGERSYGESLDRIDHKIEICNNLIHKLWLSLGSTHFKGITIREI